MNKKVLMAAVMAACMATSGLTLAQGKGNDRGRDRDERGERGGERDRRDEGRRDERHDNGRGHNDEWREGRGAGPNHAFYRGGRLPDEYRHRQYVVDDWRDHNLSAPPRGYHWVQTGGDYVLIAVATGIIASILLNQ